MSRLKKFLALLMSATMLFSAIPSFSVSVFASAELPTVTLTEMEAPADLDVAYKYVANSEETVSDYDSYLADFVISFDQDVEAGDVKLGGAYDAWDSGNWQIFDCPALSAGEEYRLMKQGVSAVLGRDVSVTYQEVRDVIREFRCGVKNVAAFDTTMTVKLCLYENEGGEAIELPTGEKSYTLEAPALPKVTVTTMEAPAGLDTAYKFTADSEETKSAYDSYLADFVISFDKDIKAGAVKLGGAYDAWDSGNWQLFDCPELKAGDEYRLIRQGVSAVLDRDVSVTYQEVRDFVKEFRCGIACLDPDVAGATMTVKLCLYKDSDSEAIEIENASKEYKFPDLIEDDSFHFYKEEEGAKEALPADYTYTVTYDPAGNQQISFAAESDNNTTGAIAYTSSNPAVAFIENEASPVVTIKGAGTATITANIQRSTTYMAAEATYTIKVKKADQSIQFASDTVSLYYGQALTVSAEPTTSYSALSEENPILYSIDDENENEIIESVNPKTGEVTFKDGVTKGSAVIKATLAGDDNFNDAEPQTCTVTIDELPVPEGAYTLPSENHNGWYNAKLQPNGVEIKAKEGFEISTSNNLADDNWASSYFVKDSGIYEGENAMKVYLRDVTSGAITGAITVTDFKYDKEAPTAPEISYTNEKHVLNLFHFFKKDNQINFESQADLANVATFEFKYSRNGATTTDSLGATDNKASKGFDEEDHYEIVSVKAIDEAGNESAIVNGEGRTIVVDETNPQVTVHYSAPSNTVEKTAGEDKIVYNYYGKNFTDNFFAEFLFTEENFYPQPVQLFWSGTEITSEDRTEDQTNKSITFEKELSEDGEYQFNAAYTDYSKNEMAPYTSPIIVVDRTDPEVSVEYKGVDKEATTGNEGQADENTAYYSTSQTARVVVKEANFDDSMAVTVTGGEVTVPADWSYDSENGVHYKEFALANDGVYTIQVTGQDLATNDVDKSFSVVIDTTAPEIAITYASDLDETTTVLKHILKTISYIFAQNSLDFTITATDETSPIASVEYGTPKADDGEEMDITSPDCKGTDTEKTIKGKIDANFKGFVWVKVTDRAGNVRIYNNKDNQDITKKELEDETVAALSDRKGVIVDNTVPTRTISLTKPVRVVDSANEFIEKEALDTYLEEINTHENDGSVFYYDATGFEFTIEIDEANFDLNKEDNDQVLPAGEVMIGEPNLTITVNENDEAVTWEKTGDTTYRATITRAEEGTYKIVVNYMDPSTNQMKEYTSQSLVVDKTAPIISLSYDDDVESPENSGMNGYRYYQNVQTATIKVDEEHFDARLMDVDITKKDMVDDSVLEEDTVRINDTDVKIADVKDYLHSAEWSTDNSISILFNDGLYDITVNGRDLSDNAAEEKTDKIAIDTESPEFMVTFDEAETSMVKRILRAITFGIYKKNASPIVKFEAEDATTLIDKIEYKALLQENVSSVNKGIGDSTLQRASKDGFYEVTYTLDGSEIETTVDGHKVTYSFELPENFRGFISAIAYDVAGNTTAIIFDGKTVNGETTTIEAVKSQTASTEKTELENKGIIVDHTAPEMVSATITAPSLVLNKDEAGNVTGASNSAQVEDMEQYQNNDVLYYGNDTAQVDFTFVVNEANFDLNEEDNEAVVVDAKKTYIKVTDEDGKTISTDADSWQPVQATTEGGEPAEDEEGNPIYVKDLYTATISFEEDGRYVVNVACKDESDNEMTYQSKEIVIDRQAPEITKFEIDTDGAYYYKDDNTDNSSTETPAEKDAEYDFYFQQQATVKVYANDTLETGAKSASGIASIILVTYDVEAEKWEVRDCEGIEFDKADGNDVAATFTVNGNFKGFMYALPIDRLGQHPTYKASGDTTDVTASGITADKYTQYIRITEGNIPAVKDSTRPVQAGYAAPFGTIIANSDKHLANSFITINPLTSANEHQRDRASKNDYNSRINAKVTGASRDLTANRDFNYTVTGNDSNVPLYNNNVNVKLSVEDNYAGIRKINYYVMGRTDQDAVNDFSGELVIDNTMKPSDSSWTLTKEENTNPNQYVDKNQPANTNLCVKAEKTITVKNNSNDIIILVVMEDRAGNKSYDYNVIGIDKDDPLIDIQYQDDQDSRASADCYKSRKAIITITERNFDEEKISATLENISGYSTAIPSEFSDITKYGQWSEDGKANIGNATNEAVQRYQFVINYTEDGEYEFAISLHDVAGNYSEKTENAFRIDTIAPTIRVILSNTDVHHNRYFNSDRTATIIVTERNYGAYNEGNADRFVNNIQTSITSDLGTPTPAKPTAATFSGSRLSNEWTSTVHFTQDGDYKLAFTVIDDAGWTATVDEHTLSNFEGASPQDFTIDTIAPVIQIDINNINQKGKTPAYKDAPEVTATVRDNNCYNLNGTGSSYTMARDQHSPVYNADYDRQGTSTDSDHVQSLQIHYAAANEDGFYHVMANAEDMAGNAANVETQSYIRNHQGSVLVLSDDLYRINRGFVNKEDFRNSDLYIDEYTWVAVDDADVSYSIKNRGSGAAIDGGITRELIHAPTDSEPWYVYRYRIDNSLEALLAEGEYVITLQSTASVDNGGSGSDTVGNNSGDNAFWEINYTVDNTNPVLTVEGLEKHLNMNQTNLPSALGVKEDHMQAIELTVYSSNDKKALADKDNPDNKKINVQKYRWIADAGKKAGTKDGEYLLGSYEVTDKYDALVKLDDILKLDNDKKLYFDLSIVVYDATGSNFATEYNQDELFTDVSSEKTRKQFFSSEGNAIVLKSVTLSKKFAPGDFIETHQAASIGTFSGLGVLLALLIIIPLLRKKRKDEDEEESELTK